ncbi:secretory carrier membrane protein, partial [Kipferlia bialata]
NISIEVTSYMLSGVFYLVLGVPLCFFVQFKSIYTGYQNARAFMIAVGLVMTCAYGVYDILSCLGLNKAAGFVTLMKLGKLEEAHGFQSFMVFFNMLLMGLLSLFEVYTAGVLLKKYKAMGGKEAAKKDGTKFANSQIKSAASNASVRNAITGAARMAMTSGSGTGSGSIV